MLVVNREIREAILRRASAEEMTRLAIAGGMTALIDDGLAKARAGLTTIEEILRLIR